VVANQMQVFAGIDTYEPHLRTTLPAAAIPDPIRTAIQTAVKIYTERESKVIAVPSSSPLSNMPRAYKTVY
jgi:hypothetical protein